MIHNSALFIKVTKMEDKKILILDAAMKVFSSEGFHKAKISKISELAGIGAGTVYLYFKNKDNILEELFVRSWSKIESRLFELVSNTSINPIQCLTEMLKSVVFMISENKELAKMVLHEYGFINSSKQVHISRIVDNIKNLLIQNFERGKELNVFNNEIDSKAMTSYIIGGLWHLLAYLAEQTDYDVISVEKQIELIVIKGIK